jgi:uncharacterized membrane protein YbhN (UPF0104 family)
LVVALFAEAASFVCTFGMQRIVLRTRGWFAIVTAALTGNTVTNVLPGGDAAGAAVQFRMLETAGIDPDAAAGGLTASSLLSIGGLLMLPILTLPAVLGGSRVNHALVNTALLGVAGFIVYVALAVLLMQTDRPLRLVGRGAQWLMNKLRRHRAPVTGLDHRLLRQRDQIRGALGREWKQILLLVVGRLGFDFLCLLATIRATGSDPHPWLVLLAYSAAGVIALIPATPGGLGIVEVGDRRGKPERPARARGRQRQQSRAGHPGLSIGPILDPDGRRACGLLVLPQAIRARTVDRTSSRSVVRRTEGRMKAACRSIAIVPSPQHEK